ncbi:MAG: AAA family ATPase [Bacteroidia bacterium]
MTYFSFPLNPQQEAVFQHLQAFADPAEPARVFMLRGYAGTGKTTLVSGFLKYLAEREIRFELLASTGRAAKVLSDKTEQTASTIHSMVYSFEDISGDIEAFAQKLESGEPGEQLKLLFRPRTAPRQAEEKDRYCIYLIDEASMVADVPGQGASFARFGDGRLLKDLLNYDTEGKFIFIGDPCQLPPVSQPMSPALDPDYIRDNFALEVWESDLTQVMRQDENNGILAASLKLRESITAFTAPLPAPALPSYGYNNIGIYHTLMDLFSLYMKTIEAQGDQYATMICQTNHQRLGINRVVRKYQDKPEGYPVEGDLLMVTQNNLITGLVNGDFIRVEAIGKRLKKAGLYFIQVDVSPLHQDTRHQVMLVEKVLNSHISNLDQLDHQQLLSSTSITGCVKRGSAKRPRLSKRP